jgi:hypothetical protein
LAATTHESAKRLQTLPGERRDDACAVDPAGPDRAHVVMSRPTKETGMADHILSQGDVPPGEPSVAQTLDLAQRVAIDRLRLFQLDLETRVKQVALRTVWTGFGALCLLVAWLGVLGAAVFALSERMPLSSSLLLVAGSQLLIGVVLIAWGRRRGQA